MLPGTCDRAISRYLIGAIMKAQSWEELEDLASKYTVQFNHIHVSALVCRLPKVVTPAQLERSEKARFSRFLGRVSDLVSLRLPSFDPRAIANVLWAVSKLGYSPAPPLLNKFLFEAYVHMHEFNAQELANLSWALATLAALGNKPVTVWLRKFVGAATLRVPELKPQELAHMTWALSRLCSPPEAADTPPSPPAAAGAAGAGAPGPEAAAQAGTTRTGGEERGGASSNAGVSSSSDPPSAGGEASSDAAQLPPPPPPPHPLGPLPELVALLTAHAVDQVPRLSGGELLMTIMSLHRLDAKSSWQLLRQALPYMLRRGLQGLSPQDLSNLWYVLGQCAAAGLAVELQAPQPGGGAVGAAAPPAGSQRGCGNGPVGALRAGGMQPGPCPSPQRAQQGDGIGNNFMRFRGRAGSPDTAAAPVAAFVGASRSASLACSASSSFSSVSPSSPLAPSAQRYPSSWSLWGSGMGRARVSSLGADCGGAGATSLSATHSGPTHGPSAVGQRVWGPAPSRQPHSSPTHIAATNGSSAPSRPTHGSPSSAPGRQPHGPPVLGRHHLYVLMECTERAAHSLSAQGVCTVSAALVHLQLQPGEALLRRLYIRLTQVLPAQSTFMCVSVTLWALARLRARPPPVVMALLLSCARLQVAAASPGELATLLWAMLQLRYRPSRSLTTRIARRLALVAHRLRPHGLQIAIHAFAMFGVAMPATLRLAALKMTGAVATAAAVARARERAAAALQLGAGGDSSGGAVGTDVAAGAIAVTRAPGSTGAAASASALQQRPQAFASAAPVAAAATAVAGRAAGSEAFQQMRPEVVEAAMASLTQQPPTVTVRFFATLAGVGMFKPKGAGRRANANHSLRLLRWVMTTTNRRSALTAALEAATSGRLGQLSTDALCALLTSMVRLYLLPSAGFLRQVHQQAEARLASLEPWQAGGLLAAMGGLKSPPREWWMLSVLSTLGSQLDELTDRQLIGVLRALARLRYRPPLEWMRALTQEAMLRDVGSWSRTTLRIFLRSLGTLGLKLGGGPCRRLQGLVLWKALPAAEDARSWGKGQGKRMGRLPARMKAVGMRKVPRVREGTPARVKAAGMRKQPGTAADFGPGSGRRVWGGGALVLRWFGSDKRLVLGGAGLRLRGSGSGMAFTDGRVLLRRGARLELRQHLCAVCRDLAACVADWGPRGTRRGYRRAPARRPTPACDR